MSVTARRVSPGRAGSVLLREDCVVYPSAPAMCEALVLRTEGEQDMAYASRGGRDISWSQSTILQCAKGD